MLNCICHDKFILINNVLKEYHYTKEKTKEIKDLNRMLSYCLKHRKNTGSKNPEFVKTKNRRIMVSSKCELRGSKKPEKISRCKKLSDY